MLSDAKTHLHGVITELWYVVGKVLAPEEHRELLLDVLVNDCGWVPNVANEYRQKQIWSGTVGHGGAAGRCGWGATPAAPPRRAPK